MRIELAIFHRDRRPLHRGRDLIERHLRALLRAVEFEEEFRPGAIVDLRGLRDGARNELAGVGEIAGRPREEHGEANAADEDTGDAEERERSKRAADARVPAARTRTVLRALGAHAAPVTG